MTSPLHAYSDVLPLELSPWSLPPGLLHLGEGLHRVGRHAGTGVREHWKGRRCSEGILSNIFQIDWDLILSMLVFTARQIHHATP